MERERQRIRERRDRLRRAPRTGGSTGEELAARDTEVGAEANSESTVREANQPAPSLDSGLHRRGVAMAAAGPDVTISDPDGGGQFIDGPGDEVSRITSAGGVIDWLDRPGRELLRLAWPIAISMVSYSVMTLADTLFVSRLGPWALAAVGFGGTAAFALMCFGMGLLRSVKVLVSQAVGAGRRSDANAYLSAGLLWALALGGTMIALGQLTAELLPQLAASAAAGIGAGRYLAIRMVGAPMVMVYVALREHRYGVGDARSPMVVAVIGNGVNVALDWLFVLELHWGVAGAAWASVIAHCMEALLMLSATRALGYRFERPRVRQLLALLRIGWPTGAQFVLEMGSFAMLSAMLVALSETEMAAHQIALQVIHFTFLPTLAVSEAASVLAGQAVGAGRYGLVHAVSRRALLIALAYAALCTIVLALGATPIAAFFTEDGSLLAKATALLYVAAVFQIFDAANVIARGALRGTGDVQVPAVIGITTAWLLTPPMMWLLGYRLGMGALGGWLGLCGEIILAAVILWWRLAGNGWQMAANRSRRDVVGIDGPS